MYKFKMTFEVVIRKNILSDASAHMFELIGEPIPYQKTTLDYSLFFENVEEFPDKNKIKEVEDVVKAAFVANFEIDGKTKVESVKFTGYNDVEAYEVDSTESVKSNEQLN